MLYARFIWEEFVTVSYWYNLRPIMQDCVEKMNIVCVFVGMAFLLMNLNSGNLNMICFIKYQVAIYGHLNT